MKKEKGIDLDYLKEVVGEVVKDVLSDSKPTGEIEDTSVSQAPRLTGSLVAFDKALENNDSLWRQIDSINSRHGFFMGAEARFEGDGLAIKQSQPICFGDFGMYTYDGKNIVPYDPQNIMMIGDAYYPMGVYVPFSAGAEGVRQAARLFSNMVDMDDCDNE